MFNHHDLSPKLQSHTPNWLPDSPAWIAHRHLSWVTHVQWRMLDSSFPNPHPPTPSDPLPGNSQQQHSPNCTLFCFYIKIGAACSCVHPTKSRMKFSFLPRATSSPQDWSPALSSDLTPLFLLVIIPPATGPPQKSGAPQSFCVWPECLLSSFSAHNPRYLCPEFFLRLLIANHHVLLHF